MKPEAQQIAIAKACPNIQLIGDYWHWSPDGKGWFGCVLNDPLQDLNAMHEAEKVLTGNKRVAYGMAIREIVGMWPSVTFATASQRAEAFLRTLNLWKEETDET